MIVCGWGGGGVYIAAACHELAGGRWLCGDRTNGRPGCAGSGANHCLLVSFPLLSELLSRTAPTGRKEEGRGGGGCSSRERKARGPTGSWGAGGTLGKGRAERMKEFE